MERLSSRIIGRPLAEAKRIHPNIRVIKIDGNQIPVQSNIEHSRLNIAIHSGIVTEVTGFY